MVNFSPNTVGIKSLKSKKLFYPTHPLPCYYYSLWKQEFSSIKPCYIQQAYVDWKSTANQAQN